MDIKLHGSVVLRQAVSDHDYKTLDYLLDYGVDINYNQPDMVYPYRATPLTIAARMGNLAMVKHLIERDADVTIAEKDGERPYTIAVSNKDTALAYYLKSLEPAEYHSLENKKYALKKYKLTDELVRFLTGDQLRLELSQNEYEIGYIDFFALTDIIERKVGGTYNLKFKLIVYRHMLYFDKVAFLKGGDIYDRDDGSYHCVDSLPFSFVTLRSSNT